MQICKQIFCLSLVALLFLGQAQQPCFADDTVSPENLQVLTPLYKPDLAEFEPPLGTYTYDVSWEGIPAATLQVKVAEDGPYYQISTIAKTYRGIDIFYKLRYQADGTLLINDLSPVRTVINQRENSRQKNTEIEFLPGGEIRATRQQKGKEEEVIQFNSNNVTLDPFSAAFLARSLDWQKGQTRVFDTFNGKQRYLISLSAEDKITMKVNDQERDVWVIIPKVEKLTEPGAITKLNRAKIYVTADKYREILEIVSSVFIGSVKTRLESFSPEPDLNDGTKFAQNKIRVSFK